MAELIIGGRRTGKTSELVKAAQENDGIVVCHSAREAKRLIEDYGLDPKMVMTHESRQRLRGARNPRYVDNIDYLLWYWFGPELAAMTMGDLDIRRLPADPKGQGESNG